MSPSSYNTWFTNSQVGVNVKNPAAAVSYRYMIMDLSDCRCDAKNRVKALFDKKVLTEQELINLCRMIDSPDLENLELVKGLLDEKEKVKVGIEAFVDKLKFWKK